MKIEQEDQRVRLTKKMIRDAFLKFLREKPLRKITVSEICQDAQINRGTFYAHYLDVYDLYDQFETELMDDLRMSISHMLEDPSKFSTNYDICREIFVLLHRNAEFCLILLNGSVGADSVSKFINLGRQIYTQAYSKLFSALPADKLDFYYTFVSSGCITLLKAWLGGEIDMSVETLALEASKIISLGSGYLMSP